DTRCPEALSHARDLGIAMQLTNIARDIGEDARVGRIYLPLNDLREAGIEPGDWLCAPACSPQLQGVIRQLLNGADELYVRADKGISLLPQDCRAAISAARHLYAEIGHQLLRAGCDPVSRRTVVPIWRKLQIVVAAIADERARWLCDLFER